MVTIDAAKLPGSGHVLGNGPERVASALFFHVPADAALLEGAGFARGPMARLARQVPKRARRNRRAERQVRKPGRERRVLEV